MCLKKMTFQYCFDGSIKKVNNLSVSSPRTWGCFSYTVAVYFIQRVFPTHVGVFLITAVPLKARLCLPHARGGVSGSSFRYHGHHESSPRTWGCFQVAKELPRGAVVFPTHVGVFPGYARGHFGASGLPHARGGVSMRPSCRGRSPWSSPRTWGCFYWKPSRPCRCNVFPTHVGVFLHEADRP